MNEQRLAMLVAETSLAEDRPLAGELQKVPEAVVPGMVSAASAGELPRTLSLAGFDKDLADLGADWPHALRTASAFLERLPSTARLYLPLIQTTAYFLLVFVLQVGILALLRSKVFGVYGTIAHDLHLAAPYRWELALSLCAIGVLPLLVLVALGAVQWKRLPGWGRHLARAREASLVAALVEASAPADIIGKWVRKSRTLRQLDSEGAYADDLLSIAADSGVRAERSMTRFVSAVRIAGFGLLTVLALGITLDVYLFTASLSHVQ